LSYLIERKGLYPVTVLKSIDKSAMHKFSEAGIVLAKDLAKQNMDDLKRKVRINENILIRILEDAKRVCS
jgi:hypothetical protein